MKRDSIAQLVALLEAGASWQAALAEVEPITGPRFVAVDWLVTEAGVAPLPLLRDLLGQLDASAQAARRIELAKAAPKATLRLVAWLPALALGFGQLAGLGSLTVLAHTPIALAAACLGAALLIGGQFWSSRMVSKAEVESRNDSFEYLLLTSCLRAGFEFRLSQELAERAASQAGLAFDLESGALDDIVKLSERTGTPLADLIGALSADRTARSLQQPGLPMFTSLEKIFCDSTPLFGQRC